MDLSLLLPERPLWLRGVFAGICLYLAATLATTVLVSFALLLPAPVGAVLLLVSGIPHGPGNILLLGLAALLPEGAGLGFAMLGGSLWFNVMVWALVGCAVAERRRRMEKPELIRLAAVMAVICLALQAVQFAIMMAPAG